MRACNDALEEEETCEHDGGLTMEGMTTCQVEMYAWVEGDGGLTMGAANGTAGGMRLTTPHLGGIDLAITAYLAGAVYQLPVNVQVCMCVCALAVSVCALSCVLLLLLGWVGVLVGMV